MLEKCRHLHKYVGDTIILRYYPDFYEKYEQPKEGYQYQVCSTCLEVTTIPLHNYALHRQKPLEFPVRVEPKLSFDEGFCSVKDAAKKLHTKENTIRVYINTGRIIGRKLMIGNRPTWEVDEASIERYKENSNWNMIKKI